MNELQHQMQDILADPLNSLVQKARDDGNTLIGYTCSLFPEPLLAVGEMHKRVKIRPEITWIPPNTLKRFEKKKKVFEKTYEK